MIDGVCKHCGADIWLDTSDTGPGGYLSGWDYIFWPPGNSMHCSGTDMEHELDEEAD